MENIVGHIPRGENFYPRDNIIRRIYRRLDSGAHVYLAAPRRVGKTAIMHHLEDNPRENYEFKYIITESVDNATDYFKHLVEALHRLKSIPGKTLDAISDLFRNINEIEVQGFKIGLGERGIAALDQLKDLIKTLDTGGKKVVIMIDEFPQTVENILRESGEGTAEQFLQLNREIRHEATENIRFILTGSIGLTTTAERLNATTAINDLNVIEIPPLSRDEAEALTVKLLDAAEVPHEAQTVQYLLDKMEWFIPFHIQLIAQELIDACEDTDEAVNEGTVDSVFDKITGRQNDHYFVNYYSRLEQTFSDNEYRFALAVLDTLTQTDELSLEQIKELAQAHSPVNYPIVLRTLLFDGYIFSTEKENQTFYSFTSPVLRLWWRNYVK